VKAGNRRFSENGKKSYPQGSVGRHCWEGTAEETWGLS